MSKIINREQLLENWKHQQELMDWLYPERLTDAEREQLRQKYLERKGGPAHEKFQRYNRKVETIRRT